VSTPQSLSECLRSLHDEYTFKVNLVLDEGREDLARQLADAHTDQALRLITGPADGRPA
jgi:hypothetical protein